MKEYIALLEDVSVPLPPPDAAEGFGRADPSGRKGAVATEYAVNDKVLARWTDGKFYNAVVKSVYGPPHARQHMIRYTDYNEQRQVSAQDIKPLPKSATHKSEQEPTNKRKVESVLSPAVSNVPPVAAAPSPVTGTVSAAPKIDADLAKQIQADANRTTAEGEQRPKKSRKLETKAHLKKAQSSWRDFQASGKVKPKESMFRSSDSTSSRGMSPPCFSGVCQSSFC